MPPQGVQCPPHGQCQWTMYMGFERNCEYTLSQGVSVRNLLGDLWMAMRLAAASPSPATSPFFVFLFHGHDPGHHHTMRLYKTILAQHTGNCRIWFEEPRQRSDALRPSSDTARKSARSL